MERRIENIYGTNNISVSLTSYLTTDAEMLSYTIELDPSITSKITKLEVQNTELTYNIVELQRILEEMKEEIRILKQMNTIC